MATLVLAAAGQALGGLLAGGVGAAVGQAAGAFAGYAFDNALFGESRTIEGPRLSELEVQSSVEGAPIPLVYGRVRLAGQVIWSTSLEEVVSEEKVGGKGGGGGATSRSYSYFGNFAVAICEGEITRLGQIWADGKLLDTTDITMRVYHGGADQMVDPLIAGKQGDCPAYRNVAYVVFERLPLADFGNRLPQLTFEVVRVVDRLENMVRAITMIPGAGEFVYGDIPVTVTPGPGAVRRENRHTSIASTNWSAAVDELLALCPNLESVALVVAWFGDDLRCGNCRILPKVEGHGRVTEGAVWRVNGVEREDAEVVSLIDERPAYGGTPADEMVIAAIRELKERGLRVMLYPFVLMDVPPDNSLPDPYGGAAQAPFPWRGRITSSLAPGMPGSPDGTASVDSDIDSFVGNANASDYNITDDIINYAGPDEWSYRRFILHHAFLAKAAGGVEAILIGSEMRGVTRLRGAADDFPFVSALTALAGDVKAVSGAANKVLYAADWSEYGGYQPGNGDLRFPLDPLWASSDIDAVGIDNYLPLADSRNGQALDGDASPYDLEQLRAHVEGGEHFDWYYASDADRKAGVRTPITDGAYGKPWVYRAKDLRSWWSEAHFERFAGVESLTSTDWTPQSKPIWFTEFGVPAIDKGANQPNVFVDPKSSESALPHFSTGARDDFIQRRAIEALLSYWGTDHPELAPADNPVSPIYGGPMIDPANLHLWTWDARPFPQFPTYGDIWSDGGNWQVGHWLNGRLGGLGLDALCRAVLEDFGVAAGTAAVLDVAGTLDGYVIAGPTTVRASLEKLLEAYGTIAVDTGERVEFRAAWRVPSVVLGADDLVELEPERAPLSLKRMQDSDLPAEVRFSARHPARDHLSYVVGSKRLEGQSRRVEQTNIGVVLDPELAGILAEKALGRRWRERDEVSFALSPHRLDLTVGDVAALGGDVYSPAAGQGEELDLRRAPQLRLSSIEDGAERRVEAVSTAEPLIIGGRLAGNGAEFPALQPGGKLFAKPEVMILDLPALPSFSPAHAPVIAAFANPWPGELAIYRGIDEGDMQPVASIERPATMGVLSAPLGPGPLAVWDEGNDVEVELFGGALFARSELEVLAGANALAIAAPDGGVEIVQFREAELTGTRRYRLSGLLRGQGGSEAQMAQGHLAGASFLLLDKAVISLPMQLEQLGIGFQYRVVPSGESLDAASVRAFAHSASGRGLSPCAPVHLKGMREAGGSIRVSWIRRTREGGDSWIAREVPLMEETEEYEVELLTLAGDLLATRTSDAPELVLSPAEELAIFGGAASSFRVRLYQISRAVGRGVACERIVHV